MADRAWRLETVDACRATFRGRFAWARASSRQRFYNSWRRFRSHGAGLERAFSRFYPELGRLAAREPAQLFIAHTLPALPSAAFAARHCGARLGFDAEDFHRGEISGNGPAQAGLLSMIEVIEQKYIPRSDYLTAASEGIAEAYAGALNVAKPVTILNVFPLSERHGRTPRAELDSERRGQGLSLYWYSQVIGGDRGLDDVLRAMSLAGTGLHLHLRGAWANGYEQAFRKLARELRVDDAVHVLPCVRPDQLVERAAQHDVGLALETGETENRRLAVSNKILNYLLAGIAIAATDVPGQRGILSAAPEAGFLFAPGDSKALADNLRQWANNPDELRKVRANARCYGESRFCWDKEKAKLIHAIGEVIPMSRHHKGTSQV